MARAAETGTCLLTCRNAQWIGPIQPYLLQPVCRGLMVQVWVQYSGGQPCAPHGGIDGRLSTNPLGIGIPLGESAMLADFSTSAISVGRARREHTHGLHAPEPIYQDPEGNLSAQPGAYVDGGTMLPTGGIHYGYKGTALSMWHEAITAAGGGEVSNPDIPGRQAVGMLIVAPGVLGDAARFAEQMHALAERIAASRPRDPDRPVRLPGQRALRDWRRARQEGIAVPADNHALLLDLARQVHVEPGDVPTG
jgi:L-lactate dehydrogenase